MLSPRIVVVALFSLAHLGTWNLLISGAGKPDNALGAQPHVPDPFQGPVKECHLPLTRLPKWIKPTHYDLNISPDFDTLTYKGVVRISIDVLAEDRPRTSTGAQGDLTGNKNQIILHAGEMLKFTSVWFAKFYLDKNALVTRHHVRVSSVCIDDTYQLLRVDLDEELEPGTSGLIHLSFSAPLNEEFTGFYASGQRQMRSDAASTTIAVTQFEPTYARLAFPCFDEPALKATFEVKITHPSNMLALTNTELIYEMNLADGKHYSEFAKTPPLSTYLVAFVIGQFDHVERDLATPRALAKDKRDKVKIRVLTAPGQSAKGDFALDIAAQAIPLLEDYFDMEFPLEKVDLVAIQDLDLGAMENWGLLTFSEDVLLVDEEHTTPHTRAFVAGTIVNMLAHQWFGNLVTVNWWIDMWLQVGFTSWMQYKLTDEVAPELGTGNRYMYLLDSHIKALDNDSLRTSRAIFPDKMPESTKHIGGLFGLVLYYKSNAIIRSLERDYLQPTIFQLAIRKYLSEHLYSNAQTSDLWDAMEEVSRMPVRKVVESWLTQPGYPLVRVMGLRNGHLQLKQQRFVALVDRLDEQEQKQFWSIPVSLLLSDGQDRAEVLRLVMEADRKQYLTSVRLPEWFNTSSASSHWLKLNADYSGFYRVEYPVQLIRKLRSPVSNKLMPPADRIELIEDARAALQTKSDEMSSQLLFEMLTWYEDEDHGAVLEVMDTAFAQLRSYFAHSGKIGHKLALFGHQLFGRLYARYGFLTEPEHGTYGQMYASYGLSPELDHGFMGSRGYAQVLSTLIELDYRPAVREALNLFRSDARGVIHYLRKPVYLAVARQGSDADYNRLFEMFDATDSQEERHRLVLALASATKVSRTMRFWSWLNRPDLTLKRKAYYVELMTKTAEGRAFVLKLYREQMSSLLALNDNDPLTDLTTKLCLESGAQAFASLDKQLSEFRMRESGWNVKKRAKQVLDWRSQVVDRDAAKLEAALDIYLGHDAPGWTDRAIHWVRGWLNKH